MRRKDREIKNKNEILKIINACEICYLGFSDGSEPYVVPMNFGIQANKVYFHCAPVGKKIDLIKRNPSVCIAFTSDHELQLQGEPQNWTTRYRSVIIQGTASLISDPEGKQQGINILLKKYSNRNFNLSKKVLSNMIIIEVRINEITGKANWN